MAQKHLYTIGYEGTNVDDFTQALVASGVKVLIDVRAVPLSRRPGFSKNKLAARLAQDDIRYIGLKGLGTPAEGRAAARKNNAGLMESIFTDHLESDDAKRDMAEAIRIAVEAPSCLLCFEHDIRCCHRRIVADRMVEQTGQEIVHLNPLLHILP